MDHFLNLVDLPNSLWCFLVLTCVNFVVERQDNHELEVMVRRFYLHLSQRVNEKVDFVDRENGLEPRLFVLLLVPFQVHTEDGVTIPGRGIEQSNMLLVLRREPWEFQHFSQQKFVEILVAHKLYRCILHRLLLEFLAVFENLTVARLHSIHLIRSYLEQLLFVQEEGCVLFCSPLILGHIALY